jgi:hypothetical protein
MRKILLPMVFVVAALLITFGVNSHADGPPPMQGNDGPELSLRSELPSIHLNDVLIKLESTDIDLLAKELGRGKVERRGDAANSIRYLCYTVSQPVSAKIWVTASELNGGTTVDGVTITRMANDAEVSKCLSVKSASVLEFGGNHLWVGDDLGRWNSLGVIKIEGENSSPRSFMFVKKATAKPMRGETATFTTIQALRLSVMNGSIESFSISQSTSD